MYFFNEGFIYKLLIDPLLSSVQDKAIRLIKPDRKIIDIACGTGALVFKLSKKAKHITGIDLSESMIETARKTQKKLNIRNVNFIVKDAKDLNCYKDNEFDISTISMVLHQFPTSVGIAILGEMKRISGEIIIIDYSCPLPDNIYNTIVYIIERLAGKEHYKNFKSFMKYGGIESFIKEVKLDKSYETKTGNNIFTVLKCKMG
jgi:ubiquinone/menaquinone biosynthesis C-methylase UbiE